MSRLHWKDGRKALFKRFAIKSNAFVHAIFLEKTIWANLNVVEWFASLKRRWCDVCSSSVSNRRHFRRLKNFPNHTYHSSKFGGGQSRRRKYQWAIDNFYFRLHIIYQTTGNRLQHWSSAKDRQVSMFIVARRLPKIVTYSRGILNAASYWQLPIVVVV